MLVHPGPRRGPLSTIRRAGIRPAFTLLELLVVIAITAVLLAVLLPALSGARAEGTKAKCLSNLHALGQALITYSMDDVRGYTSPVHPRAEIEWFYDGEYEYGGSTGVGIMGDPDFRAENRILNRYIFGSGPMSRFELYQCPTDQGVQVAPVDFEPSFFLAATINKPCLSEPPSVTAMLLRSAD